MRCDAPAFPGKRGRFRCPKADQAEIRAIRFEVFVDEQNVLAEIEIDDRDPVCIHLLAYDDGAAIGTARIDLERAGKIGRLAVRAGWRRHGVGRALMHRCLRYLIRTIRGADERNLRGDR